MQKNAFFGFFSQLVAICALASTGCGEGGGPSGLSSNPQDWPVPPRCDSRVCEVEAEVASMCVQYSEWEWAERIGEPCDNDDDPCDDGVYVCEARRGRYTCDPFMPPNSMNSYDQRSCDEGKIVRENEDTSSPHFMGWSAECRTSSSESSESCNDIDDDCDGEVDEMPARCMLVEEYRSLYHPRAERFCDCLFELNLDDRDGYHYQSEPHCLYRMAPSGSIFDFVQSYLYHEWVCFVDYDMRDTRCVRDDATCEETIACLIRLEECIRTNAREGGKDKELIEAGVDACCQSVAGTL